MNEENKVVMDPLPPVPPVPPAPQTPQGTISQEVPQANTLPKWYSRLAAYLIDTLILFFAGIPFWIIIGILSTSTGSTPSVGQSLVVSLIGLLASLAFAAYFAYFQSKDGLTLGMKFIGIKINQINGELLSFQSAYLRSLLVLAVPAFLQIIPLAGAALSGLYLLVLYIMILVDKNNQGFHDKLFNAIYSVADEKTSRAKWVLGCYCGCIGPIFIILMGTIIFGASMLLSNPNLLNSEMMKNPNLMMKESEKATKQIEKEPIIENRNQEREEERIQMNDSYNNMREDSILDQQPSVTSTQPMGSDSNNLSDVFYKACMNANNNPNIDLSKYCICAERESKNTTDVNLIVERCKDQIIMK
jgi:uncharacterized RDD family membrane protein YckC